MATAGERDAQEPDEEWPPIAGWWAIYMALAGFVAVGIVAAMRSV
jgi:hypothetical protein